MAFSLFERYRQQPSAPQPERRPGNDNPSPLENLEAERTALEKQIEMSGEASTPEDRDMLADLERRIANAKQAA